MADLRISDLVTASQLKDDDYYEISQSESGTRVSYKATLLAIAVQIATMVDFTSDLNTTSKKITGAINELKQLISLIPQFSIEVVQTLPTEDISDTTIYLVPAEDPEVGNYYEEYIHVNDAWELVGTTAVDLSAYYTKLEVDGLLATKASVTEVALKENKSDMPTDVRTIIKDCKTPKNATITNGIAQFECIEENLVKGLKVTMNPIQDLHGYDYPWVGGAGKNKLDISSVTTSTSANWGVTISNGELTVEHKNTYSTGVPKTADIELSAGTYCVSYNATTELVLDVYANGSFLKSVYDGGTFTLSASSTVYITFPNTQVTTITYKKVQLESGSTPTIYEPYSNICPISGRTEASVTRTGKNLFNNTATESGYINSTGNVVSPAAPWLHEFIKIIGGLTYTVSGCNENTSVYHVWYDENMNFISNFSRHANGTFTAPNNAVYMGICAIEMANASHDLDTIQVEIGNQATAYEPYTAETYTHTYSSTIYGGVDDFVNGGLSNEWGYIASYDGETLPGEWMSDRDAYAPDTTPTTGAEVVYRLATPTTISTSAEEITTVAGTNIISGTEPISECQYTELATVDDLRKIIGGQ